MTESNNPYAAPEQSSHAAAATPLANEAGMVNQVMIVGIFQILLGALELMMAAILAFSFALFSVSLNDPDFGGSGGLGGTPGNGEMPQTVLYGMMTYYAVVGCLALIFGVCRIVSGIRSFWFRGRLLMLVSLIGGLSSVFTCYCSPFSVGLAIYGLIVMFHSGVIKAYQMGEQGMTSAAIKERFMIAAYGPPTAGPHV